MSSTPSSEMEDRARVWVARYDDGRRNDFLVIEETDSLVEAAPAIAGSRTADVESLGTFAAFRERVETGFWLNLPAQTGFPHRITKEIDGFWNTIWEARE